MGFKGKFLFLLIVYFAGFATAVYYLSPNGRAGPASAFASSGSDDQGESKAAGVLTSLRDSAYDKMAGMDKQDFKDAYYRAVEAIKRMAESNQNPSVLSDGGEDK